MQCLHPGCSNRATRRAGRCPGHYEVWRHRQHAYGRFESLFVDAEPVREHVEKLRAAGLGMRRIEELSGVRRMTISDLRIGRSGRHGRSERVLRTTAERLLAVPLPAHAFRAVAGEQRVDSIGAVRRLQALIANGYRQGEIAERLGLDISNVGRLLRSSHCTARNYRAVVALFDELELTPGTSGKSRRRGERLGWALPLEWDEDTIDDPAAEPVRARRGGSRSAAEVAANRREAAELAARGMSPDAIAHELGVHERTVERYLAVAS